LSLPNNQGKKVCFRLNQSEKRKRPSVLFHQRTVVQPKAGRAVKSWG
jgi:hypothetical protein